MVKLVSFEYDGMEMGYEMVVAIGLVSAPDLKPTAV
jgi:hypothetical protein